MRAAGVVTLAVTAAAVTACSWAHDSCSSTGDAALSTGASDDTPCTLTVENGDRRVAVEIAASARPSTDPDAGLTPDPGPTPSCSVSVAGLTAYCRRTGNNVFVRFDDPAALKAYLGVRSDEAFGTQLHCGTFFSNGTGGLTCAL